VGGVTIEVLLAGYPDWRAVLTDNRPEDRDLGFDGQLRTAQWSFFATPPTARRHWAAGFGASPTRRA
jgi:hypothetical protein